MFAVEWRKELGGQDSESEGETGKEDFLIRFRKLAKSGARGGHRGGVFGPAEIVNHTSFNVLAGSDTPAMHFGRFCMA